MSSDIRPHAGAVRLRLLGRTLVIALLVCTTAAHAVGQGAKESQRPAPSENRVAQGAAPSTVTRRYEKEGVVVDFTLTALAGEKGARGLAAGADALATFTLSDKRTGQPLTGLHPNAWISSLKAGAPAPGEAECRDRIRTFMGGLLSARPEIDLNSYLVLTLNHDATVSFINPLVSFSITKLESLVMLPGRGADWALSHDKGSLFVSIPDRSAVVVVDTLTRKVVSTIQTGAGTSPRRVALSPDGQSLWVALDNSSGVAVLDVKARKLRGMADVGVGGLHSVAFTPDGRFAYVSSSDGESIAAVDAVSLRKVADVRVGRTPGPVAYGVASRNLYAVAINGERISVVDPEKQSVVASIPVARGVVALRFEPQGRFAFAVNQKESTVTVIDSATNKVVGTVPVVQSPDQIVFTQGYAYVRGVGSEKFSLLNLKDVAAGKLAPADVQAGQRPPKDSPEDLGVADVIAATPEGNSAMIANAPDGMIYYYVQGMMAPMGAFSNYKRRPHALLILDRSLAEVRPGVYSAPVKLRDAGRFVTSLLIDQPRVVGCFELEVAESPDAESSRTRASLVVETQFKDLRTGPQRPVALRFKLKDAATGEGVTGLKDVQVLVFEPPGLWQQRQWAKEIGGGVYEVTQTFPHAGLFNVTFRVASRGVEFRSLPFTTVTVVEEGKTDVREKRGNN